MRSVEAAMRELRAGDPARGATLDVERREAMLARIRTAPSRPATDRPRRRRGRAAFAVLAACLAMGGALAAAGVIRPGAPARSGPQLTGPHVGLGALTPGKVELLPLRVPDPRGGPPWGVRAIGTTRGVGCVEFGRVVKGQLGVLGQDGAFGDDGRFHPLPARDLSNAVCGNLDASGRLFYTGSDDAIPSSAWRGSGGCPISTIQTARPVRRCPASDLRGVYFGLLGPHATGLTYASPRGMRTVRPSGPSGAYLIVTPGRTRTHEPAQLFGFVLPAPAFESPLRTVAYDDGSVCRLDELRGRRFEEVASGRFTGSCRPLGYEPVTRRVPAQAEVAAPIATRVVQTTLGFGRKVRGLRVSFVARVSVTRASSAYELTEATSSPLAVFTQTQKDIKAGETVSFTVPAERPGRYSGTIRLGIGVSAPFPVYSYAPGPLVGRFAVELP